MPTTTLFNPDVTEYLELNGFHQIDAKDVHDGMVWRKDDLALQFWQNRIELHQQDAIKVYRIKHTYIGFDGQNIQHLIMILHCMGVITIESATKLAAEQDGNVKHIGEILNSMPVTNKLTTRNT